MTTNVDSTRGQLADTLTTLIERADNDLRRQLFDRLKAYKEHGNGMRVRFIKQQPIAALLVDAMEDGLFEFFAECDENECSDPANCGRPEGECPCLYAVQK